MEEVLQRDVKQDISNILLHLSNNIVDYYGKSGIIYQGLQEKKTLQKILIMDGTAALG